MIGVEEVRKRAVLGERRERESEGGASFLAMQVLEIPARGRGFPLVIIISVTLYVHKLIQSTTFNRIIIVQPYIKITPILIIVYNLSFLT